MANYKYDQRGVSATKDEVHAAIKNLDKGLFPNAFCKVLPDVVAGDPDFCNIMHADTAGTKTILAYLRWRETGNLELWKGIAQDAIVMNLDDMACVGCVEDIVLSSTIGRNKNLIPGEVLKAIIDGATAFVDKMADYGIRIHQSGGETADVGDVVRTVDVGYTTFARMRRDKLILNEIEAGCYVVSLASYGQASYETSYNSGMGSNGLTSARHDVLSKYYAETYADSFDANTPSEVVYCGSKRFDDVFGGHSVETLLLSATRTYMPVIKTVLDNLDRSAIRGLIHCSGGGQTKVQKFIENVHIIKDNLPPPPPLFELIKQESGTGWREMYQVFNMGARLEFYVKGEDMVKALIDVAHSFGIEAWCTGRVEACAGEAKVTIKTPDGEMITY